MCYLPRLYSEKINKLKNNKNSNKSKKKKHLQLRRYKPGSESPFAPLLTNSHDSAVPLSSLRLLQHQRLLPSVLNDVKRSFDKSCHLLYLFRLFGIHFPFPFLFSFSPLPVSHTTRIFLSRIKQWFLKSARSAAGEKHFQSGNPGVLQLSCLLGRELKLLCAQHKNADNTHHRIISSPNSNRHIANILSQCTLVTPLAAGSHSSTRMTSATPSTLPLTTTPCILSLLLAATRPHQTHPRS